MRAAIAMVSFGIAACSGPPTVELAPPVPSAPVASVGVATLDWTAPTTNTDGSALTDLAGYHVDYGSNPTALDTHVDILGTGLTTLVIEPLAPGEWYFAVRAVNAEGTSSAESEVVAKKIP
jgi:hypothetical protein